MANAIEVNTVIEVDTIRWSRNGESEKTVEVCFKQFSTRVLLRIYDATSHEWIEDTAQVVSINCISTTVGYQTKGCIIVTTKSGSTHRFTFDEFERFKRVRDYIEDVLCL